MSNPKCKLPNSQFYELKSATKVATIKATDML